MIQELEITIEEGYFGSFFDTIIQDNRRVIMLGNVLIGFQSKPKK